MSPGEITNGRFGPQFYTKNGINLYIYVSWQKAIGSWQKDLPTVPLPTAN